MVLAGAEPALVPKILRACYEVLPLGTIVSNGLRKIDADLRYRVQLSVWGDSTGDPIYRKYAGGQPGPFCLPVQLKNYKDDDRVIFVYTFNNDNIDQLDEILPMVRRGPQAHLQRVQQSRAMHIAAQDAGHAEENRDKMIAAMEEYSDTVVYSYYNAEIHTSEKSLHEQFICSYPQALGLTGIGLSRTFRSYRTDLTHAIESDCCIPDTDCADCRHYAAGSAIVSSRLRAIPTLKQSSEPGWITLTPTWPPGLSTTRRVKICTLTTGMPKGLGVPACSTTHSLEPPPECTRARIDPTALWAQEDDVTLTEVSGRSCRRSCRDI